MEKLAPAYVSSLASQLAALSAFLGGFAATFLATLLTLGHQGRLMTATIGFAVASAVSFVVTIVAAMTVTMIVHPAAPASMASLPAGLPTTIMSLGFFVGLLSLLAGIGCSGWTRSRGVGWITTVAASVGLALILAVTVRVR